MGNQINLSNQNSPLKQSRGIEKVATEIDGLDDILKGGLPAGRTTLVSGGPGTGKSLLGLEFIYRGALSGNPGIFITFEETKENVRQNAFTLGWDLDTLERSGNFSLIEGQVPPNILLSGDFDLKGLLAVIEGKAREIGADRIVIDAIDILMRFFNDPKEQQDEMLILHKWLTDQQMSAILTVKSANDKLSSEYSYLDFLADCVMYVDQRIRQQVNTKRLRVIKYRGSSYGANEYPFLVSDRGIHFSPISEVEMTYQTDSQRVSSGDRLLDAILGGGYQTGSCILISGLTGTGKTCMANIFARSACEKGQKVLYINYEESQAGMVAGMESLGIDLLPAINESALEVLSMMPESMGIEAHLFYIINALRRFQPQHLVLDAVSACKRIGGESAAFDFLLRIVDTCKKMNITAVLINQAEGGPAGHDFSGIGVSSIIDTIISLQYRDTGEELNRALVVVKSRQTRHSNKYHQYVLSDQGIQIDPGSVEKH